MEQEHRILFFGDLHGSFDHCLPMVQKHRPKAIILLGDIQAFQSVSDALKQVMELTQVWWIPGNHDTDSEEIYDNLFQSDLADYNLHGRVVDIDGYKVAGLGGVFRGKIWYPQHGSWNYFSEQEFIDKNDFKEIWREGVSLRHRSSIFPETYMELRKQSADILVTHEAPSCNRYGFQAIDRLAHNLGVSRHFHGHHHERFNYEPYFAQLGFCAYSVGLRGVSDINGVPLLDGQEDGSTDERMLRAPK